MPLLSNMPSTPASTRCGDTTIKNEEGEFGGEAMRSSEALIKCNPIMWFPLEGSDNKRFPNNTTRPFPNGELLFWLPPVATY